MVELKTIMKVQIIYKYSHYFGQIGEARPTQDDPNMKNELFVQITTSGKQKQWIYFTIDEVKPV